MKLKIPAAFCAAIALGAASCEKKAADEAGKAKEAAGEAKAAAGEAKKSAGESKEAAEKAAIAAYGAAALKIKAWGNEQQKANGDNPAAAATMLTTAVERLKAIASDGLPSDLKEAHEGFTDALGKAATALSGLGAPAGDKPEDQAAFMAKVMTPEMMALMQKMSMAGKKLGEMGEKYGLKGLNFDDKGDKSGGKDGAPADAPPAGQ